MLAGEVAKQLDVGVQTLHYYEREGLIPPAPRSPSGYRLYPPALVEQIRFVRKAQTLGLSLAEIRAILALAARGTSPCGRVQAALTEKLAEVDRRLAELHAFRDDLAHLVAEARKRGTRSLPLGGRVCSIVETAKPLPAAPDVGAPLARGRGRRPRRPAPGRSSQ
jgi:MerR family copper efflux transcriptional regulator